VNINNYTVVLLSAGTGTRKGKLTKNMPKSLLKVKNTTLLKRIILILKKKKLQNLSIIVGFKANQIIKELNNIKDIKFNIIKIKNYRTNGHACSWHAFKDYWHKVQKPIILIHTDIYFDQKYLENILASKKNNIIGIHSNRKIYRTDSIMVECKKNNRLQKLDYKINNNSTIGEVLGINKISKNTSKKIFSFMDKFLIKDKKKLSWEFMLNFFLKTHKDKFFILKNQKFLWKNINYLKDYKYIVNNVK